MDDYFEDWKDEETDALDADGVQHYFDNSEQNSEPTKIEAVIERTGITSSSDEFNQQFPTDNGRIIKEENVRCVPENNEEVEKKKSRGNKVIIGMFQWIKKTSFSDGVESDIDDETDVVAQEAANKKVRTYNKTAEMPKIIYGAPVKKKSFLFKLVVFLIACSGVGTFLGVEANSYFFYKGGKVESALACAWSWMIEYDKMPTTISPINSEVFWTSFFVGFGLLGIIGLFIWLDNDSKKQSRVGHEHGNARLGTKRDFKIFKRKFMD